MAISALFPIVSSSAIRRRLPLVGMLFHNIHPSLSLSSNPLSRLSFGSRTQGFHSSGIRMEASNQTTVINIIAFVEVANRETGKKLAGSIVKEELAASVERVPGITTVYLSKGGGVKTDSDELLLIKTRKSLLDALKEHVKANNEYVISEPEVLAVPWKDLENSTRE